MIPFEEIDDRLGAIGKNRKWLVEQTGRSDGAIRSALAPGSLPKYKTSLLQKALTDAIEKEEARQREALSIPLNTPAPIVLPDRVTIECQPEERRKWDKAAKTQQQDMDGWIVSSLNRCADLQLLLPKPSARPEPETLRFELPMLGLAAAGSPVASQLVGETVAVPRKYPAGYFVVEVNGQSMEPTLPDGCRIVCEPREYSPKHGKICVISDGYGASVKRYDGQRQAFVSDNPAFPDFTPLGDVKLQGYYVEILPR